MWNPSVITPEPEATATRGAEPGEVSPEVVLVDPELAESARTPPVRREPPERAVAEEGRYSSILRARSVAQPDAGTLRARQRLLEAGIASDVLGSVNPRRRHFRRRATLIPAISAASSVVVLVLQLYLGQGTL